ncbi:MAG: DUF1007 family protein [Thalassobaculaceae bacterium]|nr:DUF1007 family protein [Thalassobaculaceae bacterium]
MTHWRRISLIGLTLLGLLAAIARPAAAHPHVWIDLRTTIVLDQAGRVSAIGQEWLFDPIYSAYATGGADTTTDQGRQALADLVSDSMKNLREYDYFMRVRADGARLAFADVTEYAAEMREDRLLFRFTVPLATAADPVAHALDVAVFDPTYYIEMLHLEGDVIAVQGPNPAGCAARVVAPTPDMNAVVAAQALDRNASPDDTLGAQFAETVLITCG